MSRALAIALCLLSGVIGGFLTSFLVGVDGSTRFGNQRERSSASSRPSEKTAIACCSEMQNQLKQHAQRITMVETELVRLRQGSSTLDINIPGQASSEEEDLIAMDSEPGEPDPATSNLKEQANRYLDRIAAGELDVLRDRVVNIMVKQLIQRKFLQDDDVDRIGDVADAAMEFLEEKKRRVSELLVAYVNDDELNIAEVKDAIESDRVLLEDRITSITGAERSGKYASALSGMYRIPRYVYRR